MEIEELDPTDPAARSTWHDVMRRAIRADRPHHITLVHTWTAPTNIAMHRTNTAMGFRVVEHMYEVETAIA